METCINFRDQKYGLKIMHRGLRRRLVLKNHTNFCFAYFSLKPYFIGTHAVYILLVLRNLKA